MTFLSMFFIVIGLAIFETVTSIDNAVINAEVLSTMSKKARRWFLLWGMLMAVFVVRGLLPWLIVWGALPNLGFIGSLTATFSSDPQVLVAVHSAAPLLLMGGSVFLLFLFFHWLFLEPKNYGLKGERFFHAQGAWFFAVVSIMLCTIVWFAQHQNPLLAFSAVVGSTAFFITHGFKQYAEESERNLLKGGMSDLSKILYLEIIDATFSIDSVLGAFAFTLSIPLILLGNGLGAIMVRQLTVSNMERVKRYAYLKNGAMYSILCLGLIMLLGGFGVEIPEWVSPVVTVAVIGYFFTKSVREARTLRS